MSISSQWKGKHLANKSQQRRDDISEISSNPENDNGVGGDHSNQSTISHSATLISHIQNSIHHDLDDNKDVQEPACNGTGTSSITPQASNAPQTRDQLETRSIGGSTTTTTPSPPRPTPKQRKSGLTNMTKIKNVYRQKVLPRIATELENTGSTARDHLANERTWLAYVRTSLAIAGTGVALVQLFTISTNNEDAQGQNQSNSALQRAARPLGATTVMTGVFVLCVGIFRYFLVQTSMMRGQFPVARTTVISISVIIAALAAVLFGLLLGLKN